MSTRDPQPETDEPLFRCVGTSPRQPNPPAVKMLLLTSSLLKAHLRTAARAAALAGELMGRERLLLHGKRASLPMMPERLGD